MLYDMTLDALDAYGFLTSGFQLEVRVSNSGIEVLLALQRFLMYIWDFPKIRVPYSGVLIIRILLFRVLH